MDHVPILIAGGGPGGLSAACALAAEGHRVTLCDPAPEAARTARDRRTTAILQPGRALLERAGVWDLLDERPVALDEMRVVDLTGGTGAAFRSREISERPFGWNVRNGALRRALEARADALGVERRQAGVASLLNRTAEAVVTLTDGARLRAGLVIGADGKDSRVRRAAGIGVRTHRTGQRALSFTVAHRPPHANVSTELYQDGGPLVLVPLPDGDGDPPHRSAVVWMTDAADAERLSALAPQELSEAVTARSGEVLGPLAVDGDVATWPISFQIADRFAAGRVALMAEAAHAVPPIGAQGLNMSLADAALLRDLCASGPAADLAAYDRKRRPDVLARLVAVYALNAASTGTGPLGAARAPAIRALARTTPARRTLMRLGLGA